MSTSRRFDIGEETQLSFNVMNTVNVFSQAQLIPKTEATMIHDQSHTSLCHTVSVTSALRHVLKEFIENQRAVHISNNNTKEVENCEKILNGINENGKYSFNRMMAGFMGCVNPRSYTSPSESQKAAVEKVVARLCNKTAFEIPGWKRIIAVRNIFEQIGLNIDDYELSYEKLEHHNYHSVQTIKELHLKEAPPFRSTGKYFKASL